MKRRTILSAIVAAGALPMVGRADDKLPLEQMKPYLQVKTVPGDEFVVRAFFSPSCAFSKQYFPFFKNLSRTLPQGEVFEFSPLVNKLDGKPYPLAFFAVRRYYPKYLPNFIEASFTGVQELGLAPNKWAAIEKIGKAAQIPVSVPQLVKDHFRELWEDLRAATKLQAMLKITNTPTIAVAGTYTVTPEFTGGDAEQFSNLVNGVISMASLH